MRVSPLVGLLLLVPASAQADDPAHLVAEASTRDAEIVRPEVVSDPARDVDSPDYLRAFEARVLESLDRGVEQALEASVSAFAAREAERLAAKLGGSLERPIGQRWVSGTARRTCPGRPGATPALLPRRCGERPDMEGSTLADAPPAAGWRASARPAPSLCCLVVSEASRTPASTSKMRSTGSQ